MNDVKTLKPEIKQKLVQRFKVKANRDPLPSEMINIEHDALMLVEVAIEFLDDHEVRLRKIEKAIKHLLNRPRPR